MKCPFFQTECLEEDCTAYEEREYSRLSGFTVDDLYRMELLESYLEKEEYCHALNTSIPRRKKCLT